MVFQKVVNNWLFIAPSFKPLKKYDVYNNRTGDYITSFGAIKKNGEVYEIYDDKIGYYDKFSHYDLKRRQRYRNRHKKDPYNIINTPAFFSWYFLW